MMRKKFLPKSILIGMLFLSPLLKAYQAPEYIYDKSDKKYNVTFSSVELNGQQVTLSWREKNTFYQKKGFLVYVLDSSTQSYLTDFQKYEFRFKDRSAKIVYFIPEINFDASSEEDEESSDTEPYDSQI
jgi:hypothetical protein